MVWEGDDIIAISRKMIGVTDPQRAKLGTFKGDFGLSMGRNSVHGSDSKNSAEREIGIWFSPGEIFGFNKTCEKWVYEEFHEPETFSQRSHRRNGTLETFSEETLNKVMYKSFINGNSKRNAQALMNFVHQELIVRNQMISITMNETMIIEAD